MGTGESVFSKQTNKVCLERNCVTGLTDKFYCLYTLDMGGSTNFISIDFYVIYNCGGISPTFFLGIGNCLLGV